MAGSPGLTAPGDVGLHRLFDEGGGRYEARTREWGRPLFRLRGPARYGAVPLHAVPALDAGGFFLVAGKGAFGDVATGEHCCFFPLVGKRLRPVQAPGADSRFSSFPEEGEEVGPDAALWRRSGFPL